MWIGRRCLSLRRSMCLTQNPSLITRQLPKVSREKKNRISQKHFRNADQGTDPDVFTFWKHEVNVSCF